MAGGRDQPEERAARLKAALKANMGRRKAQARARSADGGRGSEGEPEGPAADAEGDAS